MSSYQTRIEILPWTQYFKKIITKTRKYSMDDEIQGQMCKNVTRNISAKYRSQSQNTLPKFQNRVWVTSFWLFLKQFEVLKHNQPQRCFPECSISKWPSLSHHPSFFRHGVTKTTKSWYTLMGGFFGNLFRVI